jgi:hypothetical protein
VKVKVVSAALGYQVHLQAQAQMRGWWQGRKGMQADKHSMSAIKMMVGTDSTCTCAAYETNGSNLSAIAHALMLH